jgi:signal peptidase I
MPVYIPAYGGRSGAVGDTQTVSVPVAVSRGRTWGRVRVAKVLSSLMLGGVLLLIVLAAGAMALGLLRFTVIDTGSMRPALNPGDVAILTSEPAADLHRGQIVAFHPPGEPHLTVTHRAVSVEHTKHGVIFQTQGDANNARDQWRAHIAGNTVWHEALKLPKFGYLVVWSQQRLVRFGLLSIIVILILSMQLGWIWRPSSA